MALLFVVEDGTGLADATSYSSVATFDAYHEGHAQETIALALSENDKKRFLVFATRTLEHRVTYDGEPTTQTQALRWPRVGVEDDEGREIADDEIPLSLQYAVAEYARVLSQEDLTEQQTPGLRRIKADTVELDFDTTRSKRSAVPESVTSFLSRIGARIRGSIPSRMVERV